MSCLRCYRERKLHTYLQCILIFIPILKLFIAIPKRNHISFSTFLWILFSNYPIVLIFEFLSGHCVHVLKINLLLLYLEAFYFSFFSGSIFHLTWKFKSELRHSFMSLSLILEEVLCFTRVDPCILWPSLAILTPSLSKIYQRDGVFA